MKRCLIALVVLALALSSCSGASASPTEIMDVLDADLPTGTVYSTNAGGEHALTPQLLAISYDIPLDFDSLEGAAIRFSSFKHPCEIAIFLCKNARAVEDVTLFCKQRIRNLIENATAFATLCGMSKEEYTEYVSAGIIVVSGRYVALIIAPDAKQLKRTFIRKT